MQHCAVRPIRPRNIPCCTQIRRIACGPHFPPPRVARRPYDFFQPYTPQWGTENWLSKSCPRNNSPPSAGRSSMRLVCFQSLDGRTRARVARPHLKNEKRITVPYRPVPQTSISLVPLKQPPEPIGFPPSRSPSQTVPVGLRPRPPPLCAVSACVPPILRGQPISSLRCGFSAQNRLPHMSHLRQKDPLRCPPRDSSEIVRCKPPAPRNFFGWSNSLGANRRGLMIRRFFPNAGGRKKCPTTRRPPGGVLFLISLRGEKGGGKSEQNASPQNTKEEKEG